MAVINIPQGWERFLEELEQGLGQAITDGRSEAQINALVAELIGKHQIPMSAERPWVVFRLLRQGAVSQWGVDVHGLKLPNGAPCTVCLTFV